MKKIFKTCIIFLLVAISITPVQAFAYNSQMLELQEVFLSEEEFSAILENGVTVYPENRATGLIVAPTVSVQKYNGELLIATRLECISTVKKCGCKLIDVYRRKTSSDSWFHYGYYEDLYTDSNISEISRLLDVHSGYYYYVKVTFYAKKNIFSTETLEITTPTVYI